MKKFWKKYKVLVIVVLAIGAFIGLSFLAEGGKEGEAELGSDVNEWKASVESDEYVITVIALSTCPHCTNYKPVISELATEYSLPIYWFEIDQVSESDANAISSTYEFTDYVGASPYTALTKKGEVVGQLEGGMDKATTLQFLKESGAVK